MYYCPQCKYILDIAGSSEQTGGYVDPELKEDSINDLNLSDSSQMSSQIGGDEYNSLIKRILEGKTIKTDDVKNITMNRLIKNNIFRNLKKTEKDMVYNIVQDLLPKKKKKILKEKPKTVKEQMAFFVCGNCGYSRRVKDNNLILSRSETSSSNTVDNYDYSSLLNGSIYPRTRKYICPNKKCESHKNIEKREAIFFRKDNTHKIIYVCSACKTVF